MNAEKIEDFEFSEFKWIEVSCTPIRRVPPEMILLSELEAWRKKHGDAELYSSVYRYLTDDPNIGCVLGGFAMDLDCEDDPDRAKREGYVLVYHLITKLKIPEHSVSIAFTGLKGIGIIVNRRVFGTEPSELLPRIHKSMAEELKEKLKLETLDLKVYDRRRLWRLENAKHPKSGLFKIRLTFSELQSLSIQQIRELASKRRPIIIRPEYHPLIPEAKEFYRRHVKKIEESLEDKKQKFTPADLSDLPIVPCAAKRLEIGADEGERNNTVFQLAVYFARAGKCLDEIRATMLDFNKRNHPPLPEDEVIHTLESAFKGVKEDKYSVGCGSEALADLCDRDRCPLFAKAVAELSEDGMSLAKDPNIKQRILDNMDKTLKCDLTNKELVLDVCVSAYGSNPQNLFMKGPPSTGKTAVAVAVTSYFPEEDVWSLGNITPKALIHGKGAYNEHDGKFYIDLFNKILVFLEAPDLETLRMLYPVLSHDKWEIEHRFVEKTARGKLKTATVVLRGWPATIFCTTQTKFLEELSARGLTSTPEINEAKFKAVIQLKGDRLSHPWKYLATDPDKELIKKLIRSLRCSETDLKRRTQVAIPYGEKLSEIFPSTQPQHQREFDKLGELIKDHAILHKYQRFLMQLPVNGEATGFIVANEADYEAACRIYMEIQEATVSGIPQYINKFFKDVIQPLSPQADYAAIRKKYVKTYKKPLGKSTLSLYLDPLQDVGWISVEPDPEDRRKNLVQVEELVQNSLDFKFKPFLSLFSPEDLESWISKIVQLATPTILTPSGERVDVTVFQLNYFRRNLDFVNELPQEEKTDKPPDQKQMFFKRIPPAEPCELCGKHPTEIDMNREDGMILRRCTKCFEKMRSELKAIKFIERQFEQGGELAA